MKIGVIGYKPNFYHKNIEEINYRGAQTILECDMIILNVNYIYEEYNFSGNYQGIPKLTNYDSVNIKEDISRRKKEFETFLKSGKTIIVITPYKDKRIIYTGRQNESGTGKNARITNIVDYMDTKEFLPIDFNTTKSRGHNIEFIRKNTKEIFNKYIDNWIYESFADEEDVSNIIAKIPNTDKVVFWYKQIYNGIVMFMPNIDFLQYEKSTGSKKEKKFLEDLYSFTQTFNQKEKKEVPQWLKKYQTIEEKELNYTIENINRQIEKLINRQDKLKIQRDDIENTKRIFTSSGDELENCVKNIFEELGFNIIKFGGNEEDLICEFDGKFFVIEIKGVDGSATEKHTAQTLKWKTNYFINTSIDGKGVLIINGFKNKELKSRNNIFPNQILKYAENQDLCLLSTIQLFNILNQFREGKITTREIANKIIKQKGISKEFNEWNQYLLENNE